MANTFAVSRNHLILGLCLPVAVFLGYLLAEPLDSGSLAVFVLLASVLVFPLLLRFHHIVLILSWNATISPYFLPGRPALWMMMAFVSLVFGLLERSVDEKKRFLNVPILTTALLGLFGVVMVTAFMTGGIGSHIFGSRTYGGKGYFYIMAAVAGYFALTSRTIPRHRANLVVAIFYLSGLTSAVSNLLVNVPALHFLYQIFPPDLAMEQVAAEGSLENGTVRISGVVMAGTAIYGFLLARHGVRGVFDLRRPWRLTLLVATLFFSLLGGFRTTLILFALVFLTLLVIEGFWRTRAMLTALGVGVIAMVLLINYSDRLPLSMQRAVSFLPLDVDPAVKQAARASTEWRLEMWKFVWPDVPKYLFRGKGYSMDPQAMYMLTDASTQSFTQSYEWAAFTGDYHNGPLSLVIPFGLYGVAAFLWFLAVGLRVLYNNYRYGAPWLRSVNAYLLAFFIARALFFMIIFGAFSADLFYFTGALGLSVALNGGECKAGESDRGEEFSGLIQKPNYV